MPEQHSNPAMEVSLPSTILVPLLAAQSGELSTIGNATFAGCHSLDSANDLLVSTTISDVRYGHYYDAADGVERDACLVIVKFDFSQHFRKRIKHLTIQLSFSPVPTADPMPGSGAANLAPGSGPEIRLYEPVFGRGQPSSATVAFETSAGISVGLGSTGVIKGDIHRSSEREHSASARLSSFQETTDTVCWRVQENRHEKDGIPPGLNCAVVLRANAPFVGSVAFTAQVRSAFWKYTGRRTALIESKHFRNRTGGLSEAEHDLLRHMERDEFGDWVKEQTRNAWVVSEH